MGTNYKPFKSIKQMISQPASKHWFARQKLTEEARGKGHHKALEKFTANGVRLLSKAEQKEKTKHWPKATKGGSVAWPETEEQKRAYQHKFKRAWND